MGSSDIGAGSDPGIPNVARVYDYLLGGTNNFATDRQLADQLIANFPATARAARQSRAFLGRAVRYCAERGVDQFLDLGSGLPTMENVHEVARRFVPAAAVVYVDNDQAVLSQASALLATSPGVTATWGDVRDPGDLLARVEATGSIDLARPVAVLLVAILHFISDDADPAGMVRVFREAMPAGSYLLLSHATHDVQPGKAARARNMYRAGSSSLVTRTRGEIAGFFAGLELVDPGLVFTPQWRPEEPVADPEAAGMYAGVGYKPR